MLPLNKLILVDFLEGPKLWAYCRRHVRDVQPGHILDIMVMSAYDIRRNRHYEFVPDTDRFYIGHEIDGERNEHVLRVMARG